MPLRPLGPVSTPPLLAGGTPSQPFPKSLPSAPFRIFPSIERASPPSIRMTSIPGAFDFFVPACFSFKPHDDVDKENTSARGLKSHAGRIASAQSTSKRLGFETPAELEAADKENGCDGPNSARSAPETDAANADADEIRVDSFLIAGAFSDASGPAEVDADAPRAVQSLMCNEVIDHELFPAHLAAAAGHGDGDADRTLDRQKARREACEVQTIGNPKTPRARGSPKSAPATLPTAQQRHAASKLASKSTRLTSKARKSAIGSCGDRAARTTHQQRALRRDTASDKRGHARKNTWVASEDKALQCALKGVSDFRAVRWAEVARLVAGRSGKQCRARWYHHVSPLVNKGAWSDAEDELLLQLARREGRRWKLISKLIGGGRTDSAVKNRYNALIARPPLPAAPTESASLPQEETLPPMALDADGCEAMEAEQSMLAWEQSIHMGDLHSIRGWEEAVEQLLMHQ